MLAVIRVPNLGVDDVTAVILVNWLPVIFVTKVTPEDVVLELKDRREENGKVSLAFELHVPKGIYEAIQTSLAKDLAQLRVRAESSES